MSSIEIKVEQIGNKASRLDSQCAAPKLISAATKKVGITTLGCKVNTYESELIGQALQTSDWQIVANTEVADLYLINTCTVTREADRQARQEVRKSVKRNPNALVVVTGCYAQMDPQACAEIPGVDLVLGNDRKLDMHKILPQLQEGGLPKVLVGDLNQHVSLPDQLLAGYEAQTRAFVQIQQGCDQGCTFCIIHVARGPSRSLAPSLIKRQVQRLVLKVDLLLELLSLDHEPSNPFRIRLSSIDPHHISDRLIELWSNEPRICSHMHLSLQSGNSLILKRMKRRYSADQVRERIVKLRQVMPELVISADVMVGFPTETEEQYLETEQMLRDIDVAFPHTFSYSERSGTPAARIPQSKQVPVIERKQRNLRLRNAAQPIQQRLRESRLGDCAWVLPEKKAKKSGFTLCRAEDYLAVLVPSDQIERGKWVEVCYRAIEGDFLVAQLC